MIVGIAHEMKVAKSASIHGVHRSVGGGVLASVSLAVSFLMEPDGCVQL